ncbi:MAG: peptide-methionine (S)-S-oxide reductase MsrA [Pontiellaceae bacterium]|nr:peptide-methionine (S)-S-oxide reductase MsrA [Pontiellaceae bacterium]MBN2783970.1 peptide-methionine (S)-S-oxide reductase MsrA [Pontiellaceae bacterium]
MKKTLMLMAVSAAVAAFGVEETEKPKMEKAVFAGGCFWGVEALFQELDGVVDTTVGYTGGHTENPTYKDVCGHGTGHAEAVEVVFDPAKVSYKVLCDYFWRLHDPTTVNRQGPDVGDQYRSAIFYLSPEQKADAEAVKPEAQTHWKKPIVTEIIPATVFYSAEEYHQDYFKKHGGHGCHYIRD